MLPTFSETNAKVVPVPRAISVSATYTAIFGLQELKRSTYRERLLEPKTAYHLYFFDRPLSIFVLKESFKKEKEIRFGGLNCNTCGNLLTLFYFYPPQALQCHPVHCVTTLNKHKGASMFSLWGMEIRLSPQPLIDEHKANNSH